MDFAVRLSFEADAFSTVFTFTIIGIAVVPFASMIGCNDCGTIESVNDDRSVLGLMSVNFSENTSVMSFCKSGGSGALVMLTAPSLMIVNCCPAGY